MNLSKLILNPYSREARRDLASPYDLHRTLVTQGFPDGKADINRMLFRIEPPRTGRREPGVVVLVQCSDAAPDWTHLPEDYCVQIEGPREISLALSPGQQLAFRLIANPTEVKKVDGTVDRKGTRRKNRRYGIIDEDEQQRWLIKRSEKLGFRLLYLSTSEFELGSRKSPTHEDKNSILHIRVRYDGLLEVINPEKLIETVESGVGRAKAFGFGLLSLAKPL